MKDTCTVKEAAFKLNFSSRYVTEMCSTGELEATQNKPKGRWRIKMRSLEKKLKLFLGA